jgi:hypothetical protein
VGYIAAKILTVPVLIGLLYYMPSIMPFYFEQLMLGVALNLQLILGIAGLATPSVWPLRVVIRGARSMLRLLARFRIGGHEYAISTLSMWLKLYEEGFHRTFIASIFSWPLGATGGGIFGTWDAWRHDQTVQYMGLLFLWMRVQLLSRPTFGCWASTLFDVLTSARLDRTPGYDATQFTQNLRTFIALDTKKKGGDIVDSSEWSRTPKDQYMSTGAMECRTLQRMDRVPRSCSDTQSIAKRSTDRVACRAAAAAEAAAAAPTS